ncbi:MAG: cyclic nucleotide-binding domain-containing protein [Bacteroidota bacterium]
MSDLLRQIFAPAKLTPAELDQVVNAFYLTEYPKNSYLLKEGQYAREYYFVESGFLRSFVVDYNGREITTGFYSRGQIVLEASSFFLRQPTREYIQALQPTTCWRIGYEQFQEMFDDIDGFREAGRFRLVQSYFALKKRTIAMVADQAKDRYLALLEEQPEILHNAPLKHIATYLGITDTSLSRIRKEVAK